MVNQHFDDPAEFLWAKNNKTILSKSGSQPNKSIAKFRKNLGTMKNHSKRKFDWGHKEVLLDNKGEKPNRFFKILLAKEEVEHHTKNLCFYYHGWFTRDHRLP